ncbi:MAG: ATPase, T2SS/T4P/T4SS family [Clostridia bacterium]
MPVLKSLKNPVVFGEESSIYRTGVQPTGKIAVHITHEILKENPRLLIGAYHDFKQKNALKNEIIRRLDKNSYFANISREGLLENIYSYMFGYGELQKFVADEDVSDIDGTRFDQFTVMRNGVREIMDIHMGDEKSFETYCKLVAIRNGGILNENDSHCRVSDLSNRLRINVSIPPRNISGPALSIRKHRNKSYSYGQLMELGMLDSPVKDMLMEYARLRKTLLICGKGGAGKTTLLRTFLNSLDEMERVLVVESDAEVYPEKKFCIEQRVKKDNEGGSLVTLDMLLKDGLTMSLDTYCIGEIVSVEAYDFIKAACSGHRMVGTIHASNAAECILRMISLAAGARIMEKENTLVEMFCNGVDAVVFLEAFRVIEMIEVTGYDPGGKRPVYRYVYGGGTP